MRDELRAAAARMSRAAIPPEQELVQPVDPTGEQTKAMIMLLQDAQLLFGDAFAHDCRMCYQTIAPAGPYLEYTGIPGMTLQLFRIEGTAWRFVVAIPGEMNSSWTATTAANRRALADAVVVAVTSAVVLGREENN